MAVVLKATRQHPAGFSKTVVIKTILPSLSSPRTFELFGAEARLSAMLSHPNIVQVYDFGVADGVPFLVLEYLEGHSVDRLRRELVRRRVTLPVGAALRIAYDLCQALAYAHHFVDPKGERRQIIHRDVSPSNIMICRNGVVKLLDFGVAKITHENWRGRTNSFHGKYSYMAPEQVSEGVIDRRVDVFAAGIVLHELLSGRRLFGGGGELDTLKKVALARVEPPSLFNPDVPRALDRVTLKALSRDPDARYASAQEMIADLEGLKEQFFTQKQLALFCADFLPEGRMARCHRRGESLVAGVPHASAEPDAPITSQDAPPTRPTPPHLRLVRDEPAPALAPALRMADTSSVNASAAETRVTLPPPLRGWNRIAPWWPRWGTGVALAASAVIMMVLMAAHLIHSTPSSTRRRGEAPSTTSSTAAAAQPAPTHTPASRSLNATSPTIADAAPAKSPAATPSFVAVRTVDDPPRRAYLRDSAPSRDSDKVRRHNGHHASTVAEGRLVEPSFVRE
jgi:serine/threonine protein kinase